MTLTRDRLNQGRHSATAQLVLFGLAVAATATGCRGCNDPVHFDEEEPIVSLYDTPCETDESCLSSEICFRGACIAECDPSLAVDSCAEGSSCSAEGVCIPEEDGVFLCGDDQGCPADMLCSTSGICEPLCEADDACLAGFSCVEGACVLATPCEADDECDSGVCDSGFCAERCVSDDGCGDFSFCGLDGYCQARCEADTDCDEGSCWRGLCVDIEPELPPLLESGDDLDAGVEADALDSDAGEGGEPEEPSSEPNCGSSEECSSDEICRSGQCAPSTDTCLSTLDCAIGEQCEDGACVVSAICTSDMECSAGTYCFRGQCRPHCSDDSECTEGFMCDEDGRCASEESNEEENFSCASSSDCEPCEVCLRGVCSITPYLCVEDEDCGAGKSCTEGVCSFTCDSDDECPSTQSCQDGLCLDDSTPPMDCVYNVECGDDAICVNTACISRCVTDEECGDQEMCSHGVCRPDIRPGPECQLSADCGDALAECFDGQCRLPCWDDDECSTGTCDMGFCTR